MLNLDEEIDKETDRLLLVLIDKSAKEAEEEIEKRGTLSIEHAIPLLLKSQYNHILHLDKELVLSRQIMDERFGKMDEKFGKMDERFSKMDERFGKIDERFGKMDERFARIEEKIGSLSLEMSQAIGSLSLEMSQAIRSLSLEIPQIYKWIVGCFIGTVTILGSLMTLLEFFGGK